MPIVRFHANLSRSGGWKPLAISDVLAKHHLGIRGPSSLRWNACLLAAEEVKMPLLQMLLQNGLRRWPRLIIFFVTREIIPSLLDRFLYGTSRVERAYTWAMENSTPGDPQSILSALDHYGSKVRFLMNVGDSKGPILKGLLDKYQPKFIVELGGYLGYSAILIASRLPEGGKLISVEYSPVHAALADKLIERAGLRDKVHVVIGDSGKVIPQLKERFGLQALDMVFIDHNKDLYLRDIQLLEATGLLKSGKSVVVGDNILFPGAPQYLEYVCAKPTGGQANRKVYYKTERLMGHIEYIPEIEDMMTVSEVL